MPSPGPLNTICDVSGIQVGTSEDRNLTTGVTVVVPNRPAVSAVDHRGGAIGARDTVLLGHGAIVEKVHAICLSGGSAYGLDAAGGVMQAMRAEGRGFAIGSEVVPIVPSAIIFDLLCGGPKTWDRPVWWELGQQAYAARGREVSQGNAGAGMGATAGSLKGGLGTVSLVDESWTVGALSVVNPVGEVIIPGTDTFWAWMFERDDELGGQIPPTKPLADISVPKGQPLANTTLSVVATDVTLTKDQATRIAIMAQDGLAHAIRPVHGPYDGDTVFVLSTGLRNASLAPAEITSLGTQAAECVARSVARGVYEAEGIEGFPGYKSSSDGT
ncbi:MAG: P1 family peptidase [Pseudomonadota bacterium]